MSPARPLGPAGPDGPCGPLDPDGPMVPTTIGDAAENEHIENHRLSQRYTPAPTHLRELLNHDYRFL